MIRTTVTGGVDQGAADLAEDARRMLVELDREVPGASALTAECRPPLDVFETGTDLEVVIDVPGVPTENLRVAIRRNTLVIVGAKVSPVSAGDGRYHLAERSYGRFARAIRLAGAFDGTRARATASAGELRVTLPRLDDRRGSMLVIPVERA
jgi:HSP20 family protein